MRERAMWWEFRIRKSDGVRVHHEKKRYRIRVPQEKMGGG